MNVRHSNDQRSLESQEAPDDTPSPSGRRRPPAHLGVVESARDLPASASPILLLGATGMLGRTWQRLLADEDVRPAAPGADRLDADGPDADRVDLTDADSVRRGVKDHHQLVINCAAYTDVDGAEKEEERARAINATGVQALADRCRAVDALLVHYSTDYVFDGTASTPYRTDHPIHPVNAYGRTKAEGEQAIRRSGCRHLIIRTSWLFAAWGSNFVLTMAKLVAERESLRVVDDQRGRPTACASLAATSRALLHEQARGTYHVAGGGACTWYDLARTIAELTKATCRITPCTTAEFPRPAPRPPYSVLDISDTERITRPLPPWQDQVAQTLRQFT